MANAECFVSIRDLTTQATWSSLDPDGYALQELDAPIEWRSALYDAPR